MTARLVSYIVLLASIVGAVGFLLWRENSRTKELTELRAQTAEQERSIEALEAQGKLLDEIIAQRVKQEVARRTARAAIHNEIQEVAREEPVVRSYLESSIPSELRNVYTRTRGEAQPTGPDGADSDRGEVPQP